MEFLKDGILYNTKTSVKIGGPIQQHCEEGYYYESLYLSKNKQYYLLYTSRDILFSKPTDVKVLSNDEAFRWAAKYLSAGSVKKHFSDKIKEG